MQRLRGLPVYVQQPHGFTDGTSQGCRLNRALYGLRKSPLWWFEEISSTPQKHGFSPLTTEMCLCKHDNGILIILYVDDLLIAGQNKELIDKVNQKTLLEYYELRELGEVREFLSITVLRDRKTHQIMLLQKPYTQRIIEKFGYADLNTTSAPWNRLFELPTEWEKMTEGSELYAQQTGSINYISCHARPDITYTVNKLTGGNSGSSTIHRKALQHLFRYLKGTSDFGIVLGGKYSMDNILTKSYRDAAFADEISSRFNTAGHVAFVGKVQYIGSQRSKP